MSRSQDQKIYLIYLNIDIFIHHKMIVEKKIQSKNKEKNIFKAIKLKRLKVQSPNLAQK